MKQLSGSLVVKGGQLPPGDESAFYQLVGGVMAYQGEDG